MTKTLKVEGMSCDHCVMHVTRALEELGGVNEANVSLDKGVAGGGLRRTPCGCCRHESGGGRGGLQNSRLILILKRHEALCLFLVSVCRTTQTFKRFLVLWRRRSLPQLRRQTPSMHRLLPCLQSARGLRHRAIKILRWTRSRQGPSLRQIS